MKIRDNSKVYDVYHLLEKNSNIVKIGEKPVVLKWLCWSCEPCDKDKNSKNTQNEEKNDEKTSKNDLEPGSHSSHSSHSKENPTSIVGYGIKFGEDAKLPIHELTEEQFRELNGNNSEGEEEY